MLEWFPHLRYDFNHLLDSGLVGIYESSALNVKRGFSLAVINRQDHTSDIQDLNTGITRLLENFWVHLVVSISIESSWQPTTSTMIARDQYRWRTCDAADTGEKQPNQPCFRAYYILQSTDVPHAFPYYRVQRLKRYLTPTSHMSLLPTRTNLRGSNVWIKLLLSMATTISSEETKIIALPKLSEISIVR